MEKGARELPSHRAVIIPATLHAEVKEFVDAENSRRHKGPRARTTIGLFVAEAVWRHLSAARRRAPRRGVK